MLAATAVGFGTLLRMSAKASLKLKHWPSVLVTARVRRTQPVFLFMILTWGRCQPVQGSIHQGSAGERGLVPEVTRRLHHSDPEMLCLLIDILHGILDDSAMRCLRRGTKRVSVDTLDDTTHLSLQS